VFTAIDGRSGQLACGHVSRWQLSWQNIGAIPQKIELESASDSDNSVGSPLEFDKIAAPGSK
jgi:hypothetical protein